MRRFLGEYNGSLRHTIHRAIIAYPNDSFTSRQLYEFMICEFPLQTNKGNPLLKGYKPRSASIPRSVNSLSSILAQAAREGVLEKYRAHPKAKYQWRKPIAMPCPECGRPLTDDHACDEIEEVKE